MSEPAPEPRAESIPATPSATTIAVLLPRSGYFAPAADLIRAGLLAARTRQGDARAIPGFYDSARVEQAPALLRRAAADGAAMVIGPLQPRAVEQLAATGDLPVPVLVLNRLRSDRAAPPGLWQLAPSPEAEAAELARHAVAAGDRRFLVIYPDTQWGRRLAGAFRDALIADGGALLAGQVYGDDAETTLAPLLAPDGGNSDPRMIDGVAVLGTRAQVGRWWPEVRSRLGKTLRGYTTSHCHTHPFDPARDRDLLDLRFVDMPGAFHADASLPADAAPGIDPIERRRLFSVGLDAWRLALARGAGRPMDQPLSGAGGSLWVDDWGRVQRRLPLARMTERGPTVIATSANTR